MFEEIQIACMYTDTLQSILCVRHDHIQGRQVTLVVCFHFQVYVHEHVWHVRKQVMSIIVIASF